MSVEPEKGRESACPLSAGSAPSGAVFLSYAREDANAARRIADALRAFGVEVWFDQDELRGGDAWDAKIRKQIHDCALFVPVISAHTQSRREGYFRREWKLGVERTHDMSAAVAFIVPVVIDETGQAAADVPEEFLRYQWTHLPHGVPTSQFIEQIRSVLASFDRAPAAVPPAPPRSAASHRGVRSPAPSRGRWALGAAATIVAIGIALFFALRPARPVAPAVAVASTKAPPPTLPSHSTAQSPVDVANPKSARADKSIAVLPFANMSDEKDANAFFADGIHEDILTNLSNIHELRVVSRTSVMPYRVTTKSMREIGRELGVAYILEGSVRRTGKTVRVTGQLIRAGTDEHVWAKNYTRDLTDIFGIQSELSQAIATELKAAISPEEKQLLDQRPTQNIAAYELVLKARELRATSFATLAQQQPLLESAIQLDPGYALAHAELAYVYAAGSFFGYFPDASGGTVAKSKAALETAIRLAPNSPDVIRASGDYHYYGNRDYALAMEQYTRVLRLRPNDGETYNRIGSVQRRQGLWRDSLASFRKAEALDPTNLNYISTVAIHLAAGQRFDEAITQQQRKFELAQDIQSGYMLAFLHYMATGSSGEMAAFFRGLTPVQMGSETGINLRKRWALHHGDLEEAIRLDRGDDSDGSFAVHMAAAFAARGDRNGMAARLRKWADTLRTGSQGAEPRPAAGSYDWGGLAMIEAMLGRKEEALRAATKAIEADPESRDATTTYNRRYIAFVHAWTGDKDAAIAEYAHLLRAPYANVYTNWISGVHVMKRDPLYFPLRGDPRFEALLNDPKNNAPLF